MAVLASISTPMPVGILRTHCPHKTLSYSGLNSGAMSTLSNVPTVIDYVPAVSIREVQIDALAVMKIVKHCGTSKENVNGMLLGMENDGLLEVTYTIPGLPKEGHEEGHMYIDTGAYRQEMLMKLRDVNIPNIEVGIYQKMSLGTAHTRELVDWLVQNTKDFKILLIYDIARSCEGNLVLKAYRLKDTYVEQRKSKINYFTKSTDLFEEVPLKIVTVGHMAAYARCLEDFSESEVDCSTQPLKLEDSDRSIMDILGEFEKWLTSGIYDRELQDQQIDLLYKQRQLKDFVHANQKLRQSHVKWLLQRMEENKQRAQDNEDPLPLDLSESGLKDVPEAPEVINDLSRMLAQLHAYRSDLNSHIHSSLSSLFVTKALSEMVSE